MIKAPKSILLVKEEIRRYYKKDVRVRVDLGRNRRAEFTGVLSGVYPALFTVQPYDASYRGKTSYAYSEVLCGSVKVQAAPKKA